MLVSMWGVEVHSESCSTAHLSCFCLYACTCHSVALSVSLNMHIQYISWLSAALDAAAAAGSGWRERRGKGASKSSAEMYL